MTVENDLQRAIVERERRRDEVKLELQALATSLAAANARRTALEDLWGATAAGAVLPLGPLSFAVVGVLAANAACFSGFVVYLTRWDNPVWAALYVASAIVGAGGLARSSGPGAGGRARVVLRLVSAAFLLLALAEGVLAFSLGR